MKFVDLFAGLGGFNAALRRLGHECVFASEIDSELRDLYAINFPEMDGRIFGDIRLCRNDVPPHDILCAGFPCQPFSKSGFQLGLHDKIKGTLFDEIVFILERCRPKCVIMENVGNFERHDKGRTWQIVKEKLETLQYDVRGTEHVTSGGSGLLSPQYFGYPHSRERFFIIAVQGQLPANPFPQGDRNCMTDLRSIVQSPDELTEHDRKETRLTSTQIECIDHWNRLLARLPDEASLPSFPIWGDEIDATYPYADHTPFSASIDELARCLNGHEVDTAWTHEELLRLLPRYAQTPQEQFPKWKVDFIRQNREWFRQYRSNFPEQWVMKLKNFPPSLRKLEWNCQGEKRDLWKYVLQFRPSGLRVKRYTSSPSLVAMTSTQIPILGPEKRFLSRVEGLRLQGFSDDHKLPSSKELAFQALGNAVHVGLVEIIASQILST